MIMPQELGWNSNLGPGAVVEVKCSRQVQEMVRVDGPKEDGPKDNLTTPTYQQYQMEDLKTH